MTEPTVDHRETIDVAIRGGVRLRICHARPGAAASVRTILPRAWTRGSEFFAWDFEGGAYHTFDAHFIVTCEPVVADARFDSSTPARAAQIAPPGRDGSTLPPIAAAAPARSVRRVSRSLYWIGAVIILAASAMLWIAADPSVPPLQRIFGTSTSTPTVTATPTPTGTPTIDPQRVRAATATAAEISRAATDAAPCHPRNGRCFDLDGRVLVLAVPPDARLLVYARPQLDPTTARAAMRHHIRAVEARNVTGDWLLLRMTDGEVRWVQAAAVGVLDARDVLPEWKPSATPARPPAMRRRTPTPQP